MSTNTVNRTHWPRSIRATAIALTLACLSATALSANAKTLRWSNEGDVTSMDPYAFYTTSNASFLQNIYEPLVRLDKELKLEPALAVSWEVIEPTTWRFKLRSGVKFHDGRSFGADDVVASLKRAGDPNSPYRVALSAVKDVVKIDDLTIDVLVKAPYPLLLNDLAAVFIMSQGWMAEHNSLEAINPAKGEDSYASMHANGTGPFMLKSRRPDAETILTSNPNWWDKPDGNITEVVFRPISSDATRVSALLSGELDLITPAPLQDVERLKKTSGVEVILGQDVRLILLGLNQGATQLNVSDIKDKNPLADQRVRKALTQAINAEALTSRILRGLTKPTANLVAPQIQGYDEALSEPLVSYGQTAAKALLADAGYPNGFEMGMDCPSDRYVNAEQVCQAIATMWAQIGVRARLTVQPITPYLKKVLGGGSDVYMIGWANSPQLDAYVLINSVLHTKGGKSGAWNPGGYSSPELDALAERISSELDMAKRQEMITAALSIHREDFGSIPLYLEPLAWATRTGVDVVQTADNKVRLWWITIN